VEIEIERLRGREKPSLKNKLKLAEEKLRKQVTQPEEDRGLVASTTEEDLVRKQQKTEITKSLESIIRWLNLNESLLDAEAIRLIDERLESHAKKAQIFLVVTIQNRMSQLLKWMESSDIIEDRLLHPDIIDSMDGADLRKTLELLEKKIDNTLHQISEMIEQSNSIPKQFEDPQKLKKITQHGEEVFKDPAVRENTRAKLQDLLDKAKGAKGR
jgi:hypothetical protein